MKDEIPDVFARRVQQSRELGVRLTRLGGQRIFLDEIPEGGNIPKTSTENVSCGPECAG